MEDGRSRQAGSMTRTGTVAIPDWPMTFHQDLDSRNYQDVDDGEGLAEDEEDEEDTAQEQRTGSAGSMTRTGTVAIPDWPMTFHQDLDSRNYQDVDDGEGLGDDDDREDAEVDYPNEGDEETPLESSINDDVEPAEGERDDESSGQNREASNRGNKNDQEDDISFGDGNSLTNRDEEYGSCDGSVYEDGSDDESSVGSYYRESDEGYETDNSLHSVEELLGKHSTTTERNDLSMPENADELCVGIGERGTQNKKDKGHFFRSNPNPPKRLHKYGGAKP